jgi:RimJ/RimL family protein N-acetyltransferase
VLASARLVLRAFTVADAELLFALDSDPEVMRFVGPYTLPNIEAYGSHIAQRILPYYDRGPDFGFVAAVEKTTGDFLGWFHMRPALDYRFAAEAGYRAGDFDLGYRLRREAWGKGYATEGSRLLIEKAFAEWGAQRVVACALIGNAASIRVLEKCGLRREEVFSFPGIEMPAVRYALGASS